MAIANRSGSVTTVMGYRTEKVDRSGTIAVGGVAQELAPENSQRRGFMIFNLSDTDLWFSTEETAVADSPSILLESGDYYEEPLWGVSVGAISIIGATTGQKFVAREW